MNKVSRNTTQFANVARAYDGNIEITGEALILALLLHTHAENRAGSDFKVIQELLDDINLDHRE